MLRLAAIVGPTAIGKTHAAIEVARRLRGEIISCDSMQVYEGMDIGTAKAGPQERARVPHHMIDIVSADQDYSVAQYQARVKGIIADLNQRGILPILVGGTGLYYQAVVDDYQFHPQDRIEEIRHHWIRVVSTNGLDYAYQTLKQVDPDYAAVISPNDQKRIVRALEVYDLTGQTFSSSQIRNRNRYQLVAVGLNMERTALYQRIDARVDDMIQMGLIDEVMELRRQGISLHHTAMQALGYKQVMYYLDGFVTLADMVTEIKRETRHYAKRQLTWFKRDPRIIWLQGDSDTITQDMVKIFLAEWQDIAGDCRNKL